MKINVLIKTRIIVELDAWEDRWNVARFFFLDTDEIWLFGRLSMPIQIRTWISEALIKAAVLQSPSCFHTAAKIYTEKWKINIGEMGNEFEEYFLLVFRIIIWIYALSVFCLQC